MSYQNSINSFLQVAPFKDTSPDTPSIDSQSLNSKPNSVMEYNKYQDEDEDLNQEQATPDNIINLTQNYKELDDAFVTKWFPYYSKLLKRLPPFCSKSTKYAELVKNIVTDTHDEYHQYRVVYLGWLTKMFHDKKEIKQYIIPGCWEDEVNLTEALQECL